ncbi:MAG: amino acid racemase [Bacteroidota bacterium]
MGQLTQFLKRKVEILEQSNVDFVALASNTPHLVFDELAASVNVNMISIVEETCKSILKTGIKKVGLLGTKSTMSRGFYQNEADRNNIDMVIPNPEDQDYVHEKYMGELVFNHINPETRQQLIRIVNNLREEEKIEGIVLGGTELPLILKQKDFDNLKVFNTTKIHVNAILDKMIS